MKYAWYAYTRYIIMLALEEKIWLMTIAERGSDDQPIRFGICMVGANANIYERRDETEGCRLRQEETTEKQFPLQTGRCCRCCNYELYWSSYDKPKLLRLQSTLTNDMVLSYVCDEAFMRMKQSLERGDVEKFDEKLSKMYDAMVFQKKVTRQWSRRGLERNLCMIKTIWIYDCWHRSMTVLS
jgi:hypothetical protein